MRSIARCTFTGLALTRLKFANRVSMLSQSLIATLLTRQAALCKFPANREPSSYPSNTNPLLRWFREDSTSGTRSFNDRGDSWILADRISGHLWLHWPVWRRSIQDFHRLLGRSPARGPAHPGNRRWLLLGYGK